MKAWILFWATTLLTLESHAIMLMGSADPERNTVAPSGPLAGSGFELQGVWNSFQGTPIGPRHFITAAHIGGAVGNVFVFRGVEYTAISTIADPESDLRIWEVRGAFPEFAALYDGVTEINKALVVVGRGAIRGNSVSVGTNLRGWVWGAWDFRLRWGTNVIDALELGPGQSAVETPIFLEVRFDANAGDDEAHIGIGDSGGGVFVEQNGQWRLAGINYAVDGPYNTAPSGPGFNGAFFDEGGLYIGGEGNWTLIPDLPTPQPGSFYATRIKARRAWINTVLAQPSTPVVIGAPRPEGPFEFVPDAVLDPATRAVRIPLSGDARYFQLDSSRARNLINPRFESGFLVFEYTD